MKDVWIVGDRFIKRNFHELPESSIEAKSAKKDDLYLNRYYNLIPKHPADVKNPSNILLRYGDIIGDAVNNCVRLPRFVIIALDKDILQAIVKTYKGKFINPLDMEEDMTEAINWLVHFTHRTINTLKTDMYYKKPGSATAAEPQFIWIKMLPQQQKSKVEFFRYKYNLLLEEKILTKKYGLIMDTSRIVRSSTFNAEGDLTEAAATEFWHEVSEQVELYDKNKSVLLPHSRSQHSKTRPTKNDDLRRKLPRPPSYRDVDRRDRIISSSSSHGYESSHPRHSKSHSRY